MKLECFTRELNKVVLEHLGAATIGILRTYKYIIIIVIRSLSYSCYSSWYSTVEDIHSRIGALRTGIYHSLAEYGCKLIKKTSTSCYGTMKCSA